MFNMAWQAKELAPAEDQGVIFGVVETPPDATIEQTSFYADMAGRSFAKVPEEEQIFQLTLPDFGFGGLVLKPWGERKRTVFQILPEVQAMVNNIPGIRMFMVTPPPLPTGGENFPVNLILSSTAEPEQILEFAQQLQQKCATNGMFAFPPQIDTKVDQPEVELVIDRDKVAALGLDMQTVGSDLGALVGGNYVNRFDLAGRSYKVIPQIERGARLNAAATGEHLRQGAGQPADSRQHLRASGKTHHAARVEPVPTIELRQVERRRHRAAGHRAEISRRRNARRFCPAATSWITPATRGFCAWKATNFCRRFALAVVLIFLVLAAQFNSFRDPFIIILGSVPLAIFGALIFCFLKMPNPNLPFWTNGWTTTHEHLFRGRA